MKVAGLFAGAAAAAQFGVNHGLLFTMIHGLYVNGQGPQAKAVTGLAVADGADKGGDHGPDGVNGTFFFQLFHLGDGSLRGNALQSHIPSLAEIAHVEVLIPGLGGVTDTVTATVLLFRRGPAAGAGNPDHGCCPAHNFPDFLNGDDLAEMLDLGFGHHLANQSLRQLFLFLVDGFQPADGDDALFNGGVEEVLDVAAPVKVSHQVFGVVVRILKPDLAVAVFGAKFTHCSSASGQMTISVGGGLLVIALYCWSCSYHITS